MKKLTFIAFSALLLASCSEENAPANPAGGDTITLSVNGPVLLSRTTTAEDGGILKTTFVAGDKVGVSASGGAIASNCEYTVAADGTALEGTPISFQYNTAAEILA